MNGKGCPGPGNVHPLRYFIEKLLINPKAKRSHVKINFGGKGSVIMKNSIKMAKK